MHTSTTVIGSPGAHAGALARRALSDVLLASVASLAAGIVALGLWSADRRPGAVLVALAALGCGWWSRERFADQRRAAVGAAAERRVGALLERVGAAVVVHGALLGGGGDADHVVAGPCLAAVETKSGRGRLQVDGARVAVGGKVLPRDPVGQARRQAAAVRKLTGVWCAAIVCVADADGAPVESGGVTVCSATDLPAVLARLPRVLDDTAAHALAARLHA